MLDFDPRDPTDARDTYGGDVYDPRWGEDPRDRDERERDADARERDPRDPFVDGLELPRGVARELVQDDRENLYELNGDDSRMLATIGAFRVVAERDLDDVRDPAGWRLRYVSIATCAHVAWSVNRTDRHCPSGWCATTSSGASAGQSSR